MVEVCKPPDGQFETQPANYRGCQPPCKQEQKAHATTVHVHVANTPIATC